MSAFLIFLAVALFQLSQRADQSNLAEHPDESAHFVTGVCLLDYVTTAFGTNPVSFAESYYVRYPKVAFGHWPPLFYGIEALWYGILGVNTLSAILLMGCIVAAAACALYWRLQRLYGVWIALLSISAFLSIPLVRTSALLLMSDMLASLFALLAVLAFCDGWTSGMRRYWIWSAVWALLAILTKESALSLLVVAALALPLLSRKTGSKIGIGFGLIIAVTLFFYVATGVFHSRDYPNVAATWPELQDRLPLVLPFTQGASIAMFLTAAYGTVEVLWFRRFPASRNQVIHVKLALVWLLVTVVSQLAARTMVEDRYFLSAYFPLTLLFAQGLHAMQCAADRISGRRAAGLAVATAWAIFSIVSIPSHRLYERRTGYAEIASQIPFDPLLPAILVSSDASGEGSFIAERLIRDRDRAGLVLRASKMLSNSDSLGNRKLLVTSVEQVREFLNSTPVHFVVLDMNGFIAPPDRDHQRLLESAIRGRPAEFRLMGDFPLYFDGRRRDHAVQVYENLDARPNPSGLIGIDMTQSLGRKLQIRLKGRSGTPVVRTASFHDSPAWLPRFPAGDQRVLSSFRIDPKDDRIDAAGGWGRVYVTAPPGHPWQAWRIPAWMTIASGSSGIGDGVLTYNLAENESGEDRWAVISVGESFFRVRQPSLSPILLPFAEWPRPSRWRLEDSAGNGSRIAVTSEGPEGADSLMLERRNPPDREAEATAVSFSGVNIESGAGYRLSLWLKAEHPALVRVRFGQKASPFNLCGLDQPIDASPQWREVSVWFQARGEGCSPDENRLSIEAGEVTGKLWLAGVALGRESLADHAAEQGEGER